MYFIKPLLFIWILPKWFLFSCLIVLDSVPSSNAKDPGCDFFGCSRFMGNSTCRIPTPKFANVESSNPSNISCLEAFEMLIAGEPIQNEEVVNF